MIPVTSLEVVNTVTHVVRTTSGVGAKFMGLFEVSLFTALATVEMLVT